MKMKFVQTCKPELISTLIHECAGLENLYAKLFASSAVDMQNIDYSTTLFCNCKMCPFIFRYMEMDIPPWGPRKLAASLGLCQAFQCY